MAGWTSCRWGRWSTGWIRGSFRFARRPQCQIHVSGGEYNVAANLADCFGLKTGVATAMVDYPIGDLIAERVRAMGVKPFYKHFEHDGVHRPEHGHGLQRPRPRRARAGGLLQPVQRSRRPAEARRLRLEARSSPAACAGSTAAASLRRSPKPRRS